MAPQPPIRTKGQEAHPVSPSMILTFSRFAPRCTRALAAAVLCGAGLAASGCSKPPAKAAAPPQPLTVSVAPVVATVLKGGVTGSGLFLGAW